MSENDVGGVKDYGKVDKARLSRLSSEQKWERAPGFSVAKRSTLKGNTVAKDRHGAWVKIYGCVDCVFKGTSVCDFGVGVRKHVNENGGHHRRGDVVMSHSNGICPKIRGLVLAYRDNLFGDDWRGLTYVKSGLFKDAFDARLVAKFKTKKGLMCDDDGSQDSNLRIGLEYNKFASDLELRLIKQEEGSKLKVTTNKLDSMRGVVDVDVESVESIDVDDL
jgi:hypothetical protein